MKETKCTHISPIVYVQDLAKSTHFYNHFLGFEVQASQPGYAYIVRDDIAIRLIEVEGDEAPSQQSCYICVEQIDQLYKQLEPNLSQLPDGRVRAPFDQPYGQREFHVIDEDSLLIFFGEAVSSMD